jgi:hypothetical protein
MPRGQNDIHAEGAHLRRVLPTVIVHREDLLHQRFRATHTHTHTHMRTWPPTVTPEGPRALKPMIVPLTVTPFRVCVDESDELTRYPIGKYPFVRASVCCTCTCSLRRNNRSGAATRAQLLSRTSYYGCRTITIWICDIPAIPCRCFRRSQPHRYKLRCIPTPLVPVSPA